MMKDETGTARSPAAGFSEHVSRLNAGRIHRLRQRFAPEKLASPARRRQLRAHEYRPPTLGRISAHRRPVPPRRADDGSFAPRHRSTQRHGSAGHRCRAALAFRRGRRRGADLLRVCAVGPRGGDRGDGARAIGARREDLLHRLRFHRPPQHPACFDLARFLAATPAA